MMRKEEIQKQIEQAVRDVKAQNPMAGSITNSVTVNFVANAQLAVGGSAAMVYLPDEGEFLAAAGNAVYLNTGTLLPIHAESIPATAQAVQKAGTLMYLFFCFTYPLAFSLYYVISNIVMTVQTQAMRKVYDPEKMRKEVEAQIEEKRKQQKRGVKSTTVKVTDPKTGKTVEKNLSASEMNKRRLEYARQLDAERYKDERTVPLSELNKQDKE